MANANRKVLRVGKNLKINGVHYCATHSGKMAGMISVSTSCTNNSRCIENASNDNEMNICTHCFSFSRMACYKSMVACYENNTNILTSRFLEDDEIPEIQHTMFRFESFGDLNNIIQVANYFKIAAKNPKVSCALWTKNPDIIQNAINTLNLVKPKNLIIIVSSCWINNAYDYDELKQFFPFVDKVFSVYTKEYASENNVKINCGARSCLTCGRCYSKKTGHQVNELLK